MIYIHSYGEINTCKKSVCDCKASIHVHSSKPYTIIHPLGVVGCMKYATHVFDRHIYKMHNLHSITILKPSYLSSQISHAHR